MGVKGARAGVRANAADRARSLAQRRETFLAHFAANCSVKDAAAVAGVPTDTLYLWRRTEAEFADAWRAALTAGYETLEARLLEHALAGGARDADTMLDGVAGSRIEPLNIELALKLLAAHRAGKREQVRRGRPPVTPVTREAMMEELLRRLDVIERRKRDQAARRVAKGAGAGPAAGRVIEHRQAGDAR